MGGKLVRLVAWGGFAACLTIFVVACRRAEETKTAAGPQQRVDQASDVAEASDIAEASDVDETNDVVDDAVDQRSSSMTSTSVGESTDQVDDRPLAEDRSSSASALAKGDINFDDLKFDIQKGQPFEDAQLNDRVRSLDGKKVKLSGYILPASTYKQTGIERFVLVRDNQECCFGPGASLFDCVYVQMVDGNTAEFAVRPVTVEGEFKIDTESYRYPGGTGPDGSSHLAVFEIEGVSVR